jgi:uncharacterized protein (TIGR02271 family)
LWGLGVLAGAIPAIGPAIAGGALAALLSSAAAGAAAAGLAGTLIGMGIPKDEAEYYESEFRSGRILVTVSAMGREMEAREILRRHGAYDSTNRSALSSEGTMEGSTRTTHAAGHTATAATAGSGTVRAVEEKLNVRKTPVESEVNVRKEVHTEHKTIDVPVTREEVVVERRTPTGQAATGQLGAGQQEIRVPVKEEHVHVEKTPVVKEEVSVSKRKVQGTERVSENLRKEEIKIENQGNADVCDNRNKKS